MRHVSLVGCNSTLLTSTDDWPSKLDAIVFSQAGAVKASLKCHGPQWYYFIRAPPRQWSTITTQLFPFHPAQTSALLNLHPIMHQPSPWLHSDFMTVETSNTSHIPIKLKGKCTYIQDKEMAMRHKRYGPVHWRVTSIWPTHNACICTLANTNTHKQIKAIPLASSVKTSTFKWPQ